VSAGAFRAGNAGVGLNASDRTTALAEVFAADALVRSHGGRRRTVKLVVGRGGSGS